MASRNYRTPALLYGGLALSDLASTELFLARGRREANPLMARRGPRVGLEVAAWAVSTWLDERASHHLTRRQLWLARSVVVLGTGYVVTRNVAAR